MPKKQKQGSRVTRRRGTKGPRAEREARAAYRQGLDRRRDKTKGA